MRLRGELVVIDHQVSSQQGFDCYFWVVRMRRRLSGWRHCDGPGILSWMRGWAHHTVAIGLSSSNSVQGYRLVSLWAWSDLWNRCRGSCAHRHLVSHFVGRGHNVHLLGRVGWSGRLRVSSGRCNVARGVVWGHCSTGVVYWRHGSHGRHSRRCGHCSRCNPNRLVDGGRLSCLSGSENLLARVHHFTFALVQSLIGNDTLLSSLRIINKLMHVWGI